MRTYRPTARLLGASLPREQAVAMPPGVALFAATRRHAMVPVDADAPCHTAWRRPRSLRADASAVCPTTWSSKRLCSSDTGRPMSINIRSAAQRQQSRAPPTPAAHTAPTAGSSASSFTPSRTHGAAQQMIALRTFSHFTEPVKRILLVRNGRSEANEDVSTYVSTPDWRIPLVSAGKKECVETGHRLAELLGDDPVYVYYSPYIRSRQTLRYVLQGYDEGRLTAGRHREWWEEDGEDPSGQCAAADGAGLERVPSSPLLAGHHNQLATSSAAVAAGSADGSGKHNSASAGSGLLDPSLVLRSGSNNRIIGVREDVRLRDGDIGRYSSTAELIHHLEERERYGKFFYRFPFGESGADVCDRVTSFLDAFQRERVEYPMDTNVVVITHGLTIRMLIKRWFHLTVDTFHRMRSPPSGSIVTLTRLHHRSCFRLDESCLEEMNLPLSLNEHNGYRFRNKRLLGSMSSGAPYM